MSNTSNLTPHPARLADIELASGTGSQPARETREQPARRHEPVTQSRLGLELSVASDLAALEPDWRRFEQSAEGTAFQSFDWLSLWHRHVGAAQDVRPAVVVGRDAAGKIVFLLPLAVTPGLVRRLTFLGDGLCDYNGPLITPELASSLRPEDIVPLWQDIRALLRRQPYLAHDAVALTKMPERIGARANPFLQLPVGLNPSGAHLTQLHGTWNEFYMAKRSSATRRRDRTKLKRLGEHGEVRFVDPADIEEIARTFAILMEQKTKAFARMGVTNLFARGGYRDFFLDLATNPRTRHLVHVSRLDVGETCAAANLGLTFGGTYYHVLASYDDGELSRFGPGVAHLRQLLQRAIEKGFHCFDFTIGDERYKLEWSDTSIKLYDHVAAASWRGWPVVFLTLAFRRTKRLVKQNRVLWQAFNGLRAAAGRLRGRPPAEADAEEPAPQDNSPPIAPR